MSSTTRAAQNDLIAQILRGFPSSNIVEAEVGEPPEPFNQVPGSVWISFKIRGGEHVEFLRGYWQTFVASGVFRDESARRGLPPLHGESIVEVLPDGSEQPAAASVIALEPQDVVDTSSANLLASLRASANASQLTIVDLELNRPLGHLAPEIVVRTAEPEEFLRDLGMSVSKIVGVINGRNEIKPRADGAYLEVLDTRGRLVAVSGYSTRTGHGAATVGPDYATSAPAANMTFGGLLQRRSP